MLVKIKFNKQPMPANQNSVKKVFQYQFDILNVLKKCIQKSSCGNWSSVSTLQELLTNVKDKLTGGQSGSSIQDQMLRLPGHIGETGRNPSTRRTKHKRATRNGDVKNHIAENHLRTKHDIRWDSASSITYSTGYYQRLTLESWFSNSRKNAIE